MKLRHLLSEIYIHGFTSSDSKSKFRRPENFDKLDDGAGWQLYGGGNDWENGITACCMYFGNGEEHGRVWFHVQFPQGMSSDSSSGGEGNRDKAKEWGQKAYKTWLKETKKIHRDSKHKINPDNPDSSWSFKDWKECFIEALMTKDMKQFVKEAGVDSTHWKAMKVSKD
jgi:hypothetical protein